MIEQDLQPGDLLMLCSDGLHGMLNDQHLGRLLEAPIESLEEATARLIEAANEAGGRDNVSVVLLRRSA